MNVYITSLSKLQGLDFAETIGADLESERAELRKSIPQPILSHYDRLVARGKKGVAVVRNQVCSGCHMRLPIGTINTLMQHDIQLCDSCGRYLFLPQAAENPVAEIPSTPGKAETKPAGKGRKRKALAQASA